MEFKGFVCNIRIDNFQQGGMKCISLVDANNGSPVAKASVNIEGYSPPDEDYTLIKDWSENEGMLDALTKAGIVEATGRKIKTGYVEAHEVRILTTT